jgi:hypothetical protein
MDKLLLESQEITTLNDSQWVFYVTESMEFGLELTNMIEDLLWEECCRDITRILMKRRLVLSYK